MPGRFELSQSKWDVLRFLRRHGLEAKLTESGEVHICCPRCYDRRYRLFYNKARRLWHCHNCDTSGGDPISYVKFVLKCDDARAVQEIVNATNLDSLLDEEEPQRKKGLDELTEEPMPDGFKPLVLPADHKSQPYWDYLIGRSISPTMVRTYGIGYCRVGSMKGRVVIPIRLFGKDRGWIARSIYDLARRKYMNSTNVHTSRLLFNLDAVAAAGGDKAVLVEGVFDALRIPDLAVATFGKKISGSQFSLLRRAGFRKLVFCYDGDATSDAKRYSEMVPWYSDCYTASLPSEYDPGNAPMMVLSRAIRNAQPWDFQRNPLEDEHVAKA